MDRLKITYICLSVVLVILDDPTFSFAHYGIHTIDAVLVLDGTPSYLRLTNSTSLENVYGCILNTSKKVNSVILSSYLKGLEVDVGSVEQTVNNVVRNLLMDPRKISRVSWTTEDLKSFKTRLARYLAINYFDNVKGADPEGHFNIKMQRRPHRRYRGREFLSKSNFEHNYHPKMLELPITFVRASEAQRINSGNEIIANFSDIIPRSESGRKNANISQRYPHLSITLQHNHTPTPLSSGNAMVVTNFDSFYPNVTGMYSTSATRRSPTSLFNPKQTTIAFSNLRELSETEETNSAQEKNLNYNESSIKATEKSITSKASNNSASKLTLPVSLEAEFNETTGKVEKQIANMDNSNGNNKANGIVGITVKELFGQHFLVQEDFQSKKAANLTQLVNEEFRNHKENIQNGSESSNGGFQTESNESWMKPDEDDFKLSTTKDYETKRLKKSKTGMKGKKKIVKKQKRWQRGKIFHTNKRQSLNNLG